MESKKTNNQLQMLNNYCDKYYDPAVSTQADQALAMIATASIQHNGNSMLNQTTNCDDPGTT
jgi:hypothetical protein